MNNDLEEMWNGAVVVQFQLLPGDSPRVTEKKSRKSFTISHVSPRTEERTFCIQTAVLTVWQPTVNRKCVEEMKPARRLEQAQLMTVRLVKGFDLWQQKVQLGAHSVADMKAYRRSRRLVPPILYLDIRWS
jgi:hypothetical protein